MARKLKSVRAEIGERWKYIVKRSGVHSEALHCLPLSPKILGSGHKTELGNGIGVLTAVVYMAPHTEAFPKRSKRTLCPWAGKCALACLGFNSGLLVTSTSQWARLWKTALFLGDRVLFRELISLEIAAHEARAAKLGKTPAVRVDGSTDTGFGAELAPNFPGVQFYDYTKGIARLARPRAANYHLTYSVSELSPADLTPIAENLAVVFDIRKGEALPETFAGRRVIDGDTHDARFTDPAGVVVGLSFKAAADREGHKTLAGDFIAKV